MIKTRLYDLTARLLRGGGEADRDSDRPRRRLRGGDGERVYDLPRSPALRGTGDRDLEYDRSRGGAAALRGAGERDRDNDLDAEREREREYDRDEVDRFLLRSRGGVADCERDRPRAAGLSRGGEEEPL